MGYFLVLKHQQEQQVSSQKVMIMECKGGMGLSTTIVANQGDTDQIYNIWNFIGYVVRS